MNTPHWTALVIFYAIMSGSKTGVATQIAREEERALYFHCFGHSLNLAVTDSVKKSKVCCDALETAMQVAAY